MSGYIEIVLPSNSRSQDEIQRSLSESFRLKERLAVRESMHTEFYQRGNHREKDSEEDREEDYEKYEKNRTPSQRLKGPLCGAGRSPQICAAAAGC